MEVHARPVLSENFNDTAEFKVFWIVLGKLRRAVAGVLESDSVRSYSVQMCVVRSLLKASCVPNE